ncbi:MAG: hypothetical protein H6945_18820 [Zoogloeaceae bacterium]|nr:hypothetical protein [Zoogloeaceae bacterium]
MLQSSPLGRSPRSLLALALFALLAVGCSSTPDPTVVAATFQAEENLNPIPPDGRRRWWFACMN